MCVHIRVLVSRRALVHWYVWRLVARGLHGRRLDLRRHIRRADHHRAWALAPRRHALRAVHLSHLRRLRERRVEIIVQKHFASQKIGLRAHAEPVSERARKRRADTAVGKRGGELTGRGSERSGGGARFFSGRGLLPGCELCAAGGRAGRRAGWGGGGAGGGGSPWRRRRGRRAAACGTRSRCGCPGATTRRGGRRTRRRAEGTSGFDTVRREDEGLRVGGRGRGGKGGYKAARTAASRTHG